MASEELLGRLLVPRGGTARLHYEPVHLSLAPTEEGGEQVLVELILIAVVAEDRLLVAVPDSAWGRTIAERIMPRGSLQQAIRVEVKVTLSSNPEEELPDEKMNLWVGLLEKKIVKKLGMGVVISPTASIFVERDDGSFISPYGPALADVAEDHFAFQSAQSAPEGPVGEAVEARFQKLEKMLEGLQDTVEKAVGRPAPRKEPAAKLIEAAAKPATRRSTPIRGAAGDVEHLDPAVVSSALQAGIPQEQLGQLGKMLKKDNRMQDAEARKVTRKKASVLSESEEEEEEEYIEEAEPEEQAEGNPAPLVEKAVLQLTKIVGSLAKKKKGSKDLDLCLDAAQEGGAVESSSSQSSSRSKAAAYKRLRGALTEHPGLLCQAIEDAMEEDFAQLRAAPGSAALPISTRGWIEHRSRLQYYQNTIRFAWILGGIHDALRQNRLEEAKARTLLAITGLDQASLDGGSWALSQEILLEAPPPFSSFAGKKLPEAWEQATSKLLDDRWAEVLMWRLRDRDQFVEARKRLQSGRVSNPPPVRDPQNPGDRDPKPKKTPKPKGGKGGGKSSEEDPRPVAN